ncbi:MAG: sigma-54-dependent transcriptional regulator [bacterium]
MNSGRSSKNSILIVDDERDMRWALAQILTAQDYKTFEANSGEEALRMVQDRVPDVILLDKMMPGSMDGIETLKRIKELESSVPIIILTACGEVKTAVEAVKLGAYDYITKPFDEDELILTIHRAIKNHQLLHEVHSLRKQLENRDSLESVMGRSSAITEIHKAIEKVAATKFTVLIQGESGTGKEIVARAIHEFSTISDKPFVAVDCGAIPDTLVESELFGYERGAFTGANRAKEGQFELADSGTIFLDEIGNLPYHVQQKLLRVIQERRVQRLGAKRTRKINVRIIAATNCSLEKKVQQGEFRADLYYRLNEFIILVPPLRDRKEDIIHLSNRFLAETQKELDKKISGMSEKFVRRLLNHPWKGNVRELKNVIRRAALLCEDTIDEVHLVFDEPNSDITSTAVLTFSDQSISPLKDTVRKVVSKVEREVIENVLQKTQGNKSKAARALEVDYKTLLTKIKSYGIRSMDFVP